jgi:hypothetical protein
MKATMFLGSLFLVAAGCQLSVDENHGGCGAQLGDACTVSAECQSGLSCVAEVCVDDGSHTTASSDGGGGAGGGSADGGGGSGGGSSACTSNDDCDEGFVCDEDGSCREPTCEEIGDEASCVARAECEPVYAGIDCSCGPGCECQPSEPGCVCQSFEFFACRSQ